MRERPMVEFTPKEVAYSIAMSWLKMAYKGRTSDIDDYASDLQKVRRQKIRKQIAKLHNSLLEKSGLDGLCLMESTTEDE